MSSYRISEVAERTGYSKPTLRYYESIGLLPPPRRTANGYRVYDDSTVDRLAFISRARQLGCSLDEVGALAEAWDQGRCGPLQEGLRAAVEAKLGEARSRIAELRALVAQLHQVQATLGTHTPDGPCDDRCGCTEAAPGMADPAAPVPVACTLGDRGAVAQRVDQWRALLADVVSQEAIEGGLRLTFAAGTPVAAIAELAAAEQDCCRFFDFALTLDGRGPALSVRAPAEGQDVLRALFGTQAAG